MEQTEVEVTMWPVRYLAEHPDNPRTVRVDNQQFRDLQESVKANGVIEPLIVRNMPDKGIRLGERDLWRQVLSGHRRLMAATLAGLDGVPVLNKGDLPDDLAFDIVAMANLHEDLTPLEEGRRIANWLDKYGQDVAAVASKIGKPLHWVIQHAEIARGLSAEWVKAAEGRTEVKYWGGDGNPFERWTAGHWAVIARLPEGLQASELGKFLGGKYCSYDRWSVKELQSRIKLEQLKLVEAPFEVATCGCCLNRTDRQPLLWGEAAEEATGDKARCLDKKCWEKKAAAYAKREFKAAAADKGVPDAVPVSLLVCPQDYQGRDRYAERIRELKKRYGPKLLTADEVEVVPEGTTGAVAAIAVAGVRGKRAMGVQWVKPVRETAGSGRGCGGNFETPKMKAERIASDRWQKVMREAGKRFCKISLEQVPSPQLAALLVLDRVGEEDEKIRKKLLVAWKNGEQAVYELISERIWSDLRARFSSLSMYGSSWESGKVLAYGEILGVDVQAMYDAIVAAEEPVPETAQDVKPKKGRRKTTEALTPGVCRVCGCTDADCSGCVEKTGEACEWVDEARTLCSACDSDVPAAKAKEKVKRASGAARRKKARGEKAEDLNDHADGTDDGGIDE